MSSQNNVRDSTDSIEKGEAVGLRPGSDLGPTSPTGQAVQTSSRRPRMQSLDVDNASLLEAHPLPSPASPDRMALRAGLQAMVDAAVESSPRLQDDPAQEDVDFPQEPLSSGSAPQPLAVKSPSSAFGTVNHVRPVSSPQGDAVEEKWSPPLEGQKRTLSSPSQTMLASPLDRAVASPIPQASGSMNLIQRFNTGRQAASISGGPPEKAPVMKQDEGPSKGLDPQSGPRPMATPMTLNQEGRSLLQPDEAPSPSVLVAESAGRKTGMPNHRQAFDVDDPEQVLAESLRVLDEIQDMIREELKLAPGAPLGNQPPGLMSRVPRPLLAALEETVQVIMDAREQLNRQNDEQMASPKSQIRSGSAGPKSSRKLSASPLSSSARHDQIHPPGISSGNRGGVGRHVPSASPPNPGLNQHVLNSSPRPYNSGYRYPDGEASETGSRLSSGSRATSTSQRHIDGRSRGGSKYNDIGVRNHDFMREAPPLEWLEAQERRVANEQRQKLQRVQRELRLIEEIRIKGEQAQHDHKKALEKSLASMAGLKENASRATAQSNWFAYQEALNRETRL